MKTFYLTGDNLCNGRQFVVLGFIFRTTIRKVGQKVRKSRATQIVAPREKDDNLWWGDNLWCEILHKLSPGDNLWRATICGVTRVIAKYVECQCDFKSEIKTAIGTLQLKNMIEECITCKLRKLKQIR